MGTATIKVNLELVNEKVMFVGTSESNPSNPITMDYLPPLGNGEGFLGLELLVMSFAGCVSTGIVALLRRAGKDVGKYGMKVTGTKRENPLSLERIDFRLSVESSDLTEEELEETVRMASKISPVWIAIEGNVGVAWEFGIIRPA